MCVCVCDGDAIVSAAVCFTIRECGGVWDKILE